MSYCAINVAAYVGKSGSEVLREVGMEEKAMENICVRFATTSATEADGVGSGSLIDSMAKIEKLVRS